MDLIQDQYQFIKSVLLHEKGKRRIKEYFYIKFHAIYAKGDIASITISRLQKSYLKLFNQQILEPANIIQMKLEVCIFTQFLC